MAPKQAKRAVEAEEEEEEEEETSGSEALVSDSGEEEEDEEEDEDEEEAAQLPAPDDGEGSDFEELQASRQQSCATLPSAHRLRRWTLSSSTSRP